MLEAVKVALDPTPAQEALLWSHAGAARFAFNAALAYVRAALEAGVSIGWSYYELRKWWNEAKKTLAVRDDGTPWWPENSKEAYNSGLEGVADALRNWFRSRKGERKGPRMGFPKFRAKDTATPRFAYATGSFGPIEGDPKALKLPRIGRVHCMEDVTARVGPGRVLRMSVSFKAGRWFASLTVERPDPPTPAPPKGGPVGVDVGIHERATLSDGTTVANPRHLAKAERKLAKAQKALSRKAKGSKRRKLAREKVARLHAHVANQRNDFLHKLTTMLARGHAHICVEDLNVAGMVKNHRLAKAVMDAAFGGFRRQLEYKCARTGARLHVVDRWHPSSKTCSDCGTVRAKLSLSERTYHCGNCGLVMDRDLNAAINILREGMKPPVAGSAPETPNARGGTTRRDSPLGCATLDPVKREPDGHAHATTGADGRKDVLQANNKLTCNGNPHHQHWQRSRRDRRQ